MKRLMLALATVLRLSAPRRLTAGLGVGPRAGRGPRLDIGIADTLDGLRLDRVGERGDGSGAQRWLDRNVVDDDRDQSQPHAVVRFALSDVATGQPSQGEGESLTPALDNHPPGAILHADDHPRFATGEPLDGHLHSDLGHYASHSFAKS
jgi:hypothetical protein